jgi:single-strand DNA-binding protein
VANDLNRVQLIGRLTRDPELRQTGSGTSYCRFGIANNRNYTTNGERREEVSFFNCTAWGRQAEIINQYCRKGKQVAVDGRLQQRSWEDKEGKKQSSVDVIVEQLQMLGAPGDGGGQGGGGSYGGGESGGGGSYGGGGGPSGGSQSSGHSSGYSSEPITQGGFSEPAPPYGGDSMDDDDIPF